jgi:hypothetical protein
MGLYIVADGEHAINDELLFSVTVRFIPPEEKPVLKIV